MSDNTEKRNTTLTANSCPSASVPIIAYECIGLSFGEILKIHRNCHVSKPIKKNPDLIVEIRLSEATLSCLIRGGVCVEAYFQTDDI